MAIESPVSLIALPHAQAASSADQISLNVDPSATVTEVIDEGTLVSDEPQALPSVQPFKMSIEN